MLVKNTSKLPLYNFQEPTVNRELSQERKERPNKHGCSRKGGVGKVCVRGSAPVKQGFGGMSGHL